MAKRWRFLEKSPQAITFAEKLGLPPILTNLLIHRGIDTEDKIKEFIYGDREALSSPFSLINMASGAERIKKAIVLGEKITIYGDYDVDGFCSATLLKRALTHFYDNVDIYIPDRLEEGYGLNEMALDSLLAKGTRLVVTVDCGVSSTELVNQFIKKGLDFVITDHHALPEVLPKTIVINPLLERDVDAPYANLSGCGVAFMLSLALAKVLEADKKTSESIFSLIDIAAIATVADVMKLTQDNRIIVKEGLKAIKKNPRTFIQTILEVSNLPLDSFDSETIGYQIAPRINACGRLNEIELGINFLLEDDLQKSKALVKKVDELNQKRKALAEDILKDAIFQIESEKRASNTAIVVYGDYHQGVIGIVASRLVGLYGVPAVVLAKNEDSYTGSARSLKGFPLPELLHSVSEYLTRYGGHAMAAGMSLLEINLEKFKVAFQNRVQALPQDLYEEEVEVALTLETSQVTPKLYEALNLLEPTGHHNPKPILSFCSKQGYQLKACGADKSHLQLNIEGFRGIGFGQAKHLEWYQAESPCDMAFTLKKNYFRGQEKLEFVLEDFRPSFLAGDSLDKTLYLKGDSYLQQDDYQDIEFQQSFYTKIVGVSYENRQSMLASLGEKSRLELKREPDNPVDFYAIQVVSGNQVLGYLKKGLAKHLAPLIDNGSLYAISEWQKTGGEEKNFGINLRLERIDSELPTVTERLKDYSLEKLREVLLPFGIYSKVQNEALEFLKKDKKAFVIMPTGRGKSLIYQTRALELAKAGETTIVISPLRSLITDQYQGLKAKVSDFSVNVIKITGDLAQSEKALFSENYLLGHYDIIFTTPEYFIAHKDTFLAKEIGLLVLDEAHYLASRREGYKALGSLIEQLETECLALTATAEDLTYQKIIEVLNQPPVVIDNFIKDNQVIVDHRRVSNKFDYLKTLALKGEKALIYVNSRRQAFEIAKQLRESASYEIRENIAYYHSGLPRKTREEVERRFKNGEYHLLIATSAFGEGIDIKDIRHLVFYHLPFSKEAFNQIAGRAGRDNEKTSIHLLYNETDESLNQKILDLSSPTREMLVELYLVLKRDYSFDEALPYNTGVFLKQLEAKGEYYDKTQIRLALNIFSELGLVDLSKIEGEKLLRLLPQTSKLNLENSMTYLEGQTERQAFSDLKEIAFQKDLDLIKALINKALAPKGEEENNE